MQSSTIQILLAALVGGLLLAAVFLSPFSSSSTSSTGPIDQGQLSTSDGNSFIIYESGPKNAPAAIMIVHDWFGISDFTKEAVERFGSMGYHTIAIDLYNGESATTHDVAFQLMSGLQMESVIQKLNAGLAYISKPNRKIATIGFSMGSPWALEANLHNPDDVDASILIYGDMERDPARLEVLQSPVMAITGSRDNPGQLTEFMASLEGIGKSAEIYIYPGARHAYSQPLFNGGQNYDAEATRITWMLADDFLERHLR